jgi:endonuclease G
MKNIFFIILITLILSSCETNTVASKQEDNIIAPSIHLECGVPTDNDSTDDYLIIRPQYTLSYNYKLSVPNWVSWEMNADWFGDVERYGGNFITDNNLPSNFTKIKHTDYTNSGFDRGHLVRSEERTKTDEDNKSTFLMTNIIPQTQDLNRGVWLDLEYHLENLCKKENKQLFVIAGGIYKSNSFINEIVAIPDTCFKIVVILEKGQKRKDITKDTQIIAVKMPNIDGISKDDWERYITTINSIEFSTGYNFLNYIKDDIEEILESK